MWACAVLVVLGIAAYAIASYWAAKTIRTEISRIRAAGEPLTFGELSKASPEVPAAQDAGPWYRAAEELVTTDYTADEANYNLFFGRELLPTPFPPAALEWARQAAGANSEALHLLDRGSALPGCNADIQLQYGIAVSLRPLGRARGLFNAASLRTRIGALDGHPDQAVDSLISTLGLLRLFERQPVLVDALVQAAILNRADQDVAFILNYARPTDADLQRLDAALRDAQLVTPRQIFVAERVYALELNRNLIANGTELPPASEDEPLLPERQHFASLGIMGRIMVAKMMGFQARTIDAAGADWPENLAAMQRVADSATSIFDKILAPSFGHAMVSYGQTLASHRSTRIAVQIELFRRTHNNQLPTSLTDLPDAGSLARDPFTGKSLLFVKTPEGYCVMSAGRGNPNDDSRKIDRDADPVRWSERWGIHVRHAE
jgi:hypothetical protein